MGHGWRQMRGAGLRMVPTVAMGDARWVREGVRSTVLVLIWIAVLVLRGTLSGGRCKDMDKDKDKHNYKDKGISRRLLLPLVRLAACALQNRRESGVSRLIAGIKLFRPPRVTRTALLL